MENPGLSGRIQMEWFIPVEIFRKKSNTFRGITFFRFLTKRAKFFAPFVWITSDRLQVERKRKIYRYFVNGTTQSRSCFRCQNKYQYHLTEICHRNFRTNGKRSWPQVIFLKFIYFPEPPDPTQSYPSCMSIYLKSLLPWPGMWWGNDVYIQNISVFCLWSNRLRIILNGDATSMINVRRYYYTFTTDGLFLVYFVTAALYHLGYVDLAMSKLKLFLSIPFLVQLLNCKRRIVRFPYSPIHLVCIHVSTLFILAFCVKYYEMAACLINVSDVQYICIQLFRERLSD